MSLCFFSNNSDVFLVTCWIGYLQESRFPVVLVWLNLPGVHISIVRVRGFGSKELLEGWIHQSDLKYWFKKVFSAKFSELNKDLKTISCDRSTLLKSRGTPVTFKLTNLGDDEEKWSECSPCWKHPESVRICLGKDLQRRVDWRNESQKRSTVDLTFIQLD